MDCLNTIGSKRGYCYFANLVKTILIQRNVDSYIVGSDMIGALLRLLLSLVSACFLSPHRFAELLLIANKRSTNLFFLTVIMD